MAAEPINVFSHKIDPRGVLEVLRGMAPDLEVVGAADNWERIVIATPKRLLRRSTRIIFGHDREYYAGDGWPMQVQGMMGYFQQFPENVHTGRIMDLISSFRFALAVPEAEPELDIESRDERLKYVFAVAKHLGGAIFTPSSLRDASGRVLLHAAGDADPAAVMPKIYKEVPAAPREEVPRALGGTSDVGPRPSAGRVARRALALAAVSGRALLEQENRADGGVERTRRGILDWVKAIDIGEEVEPDEWKLLQRPLGASPDRDTVNATWRLEGLAVLAWAMKRFELPAYDELVNPGRLLRSMAILNAGEAKGMIAAPAMRSNEEIDALAEHIWAVNWRLTEFRVNPGAVKMKDLERHQWFGGLESKKLRLMDGDLALGAQPVSRAPETLFRQCVSSALERHIAVNWLCGHSEIYSKTDTST